MAFSENLFRLQKEKAITNYKLAKTIGVHASTVKNWQDGKTPRLEHAKKIADFFGTTIENMMK